ncbi:MAG TPA: glycosyltransferase family 4 protein [Phycisphaerae bacterium]|nr:glycosyltransferase family 4 protein [Phycisphaerae bacterium]
MSDFIRCRPDGSQAALRAVLVVDTLCSGGKERVVALLASGLAASGCEVAVITLRRTGTLGLELASRGICVVEIDSSRRFDMRAILRIRRFLKNFRPDVINVHDRASLVYVSAANKGLAGRLIMTCHGLLGGRNHARFDELWASRQVDGVTAVSRDVAGAYVKLLQLRPIVKIIENGIEPARVNRDGGAALRKELGIDNDDMMLLSVGNVKPEKGYEDLIAAAQILSRRNLPKKLRFIVAGNIADEKYYNQLQAMLADANLGQTVKFVGGKADIDTYYSAADVFVMSSRSEGLPMVLLEAMSAGLPSVATAVGGISRVIGDDCGLLCPPAKPEMLAASIELMCVDSELRRKVGLAGRRKVLEKYSSSVMTRAYMDYFQKISRHCEYGVVMVSPALPLEGGMTSVSESLIEGLEHRMTVRGINSGKLTPQHRSIFRGLAAQRNLRRQMLKNIRRMENCICHIHTCSGMSFWRDAWLAAAAGQAGAKVLLHIHGARFDSFMGELGWMMKRRAGKILSRADGVITLGETLRSKYSALQPDENIKWLVVHNGVKIPEKTADGGSGKFLFLGNYSRRKGAADLIKALAVTRDGGNALCANIAGIETQQGQMKQLQNMIDELGIQKQATLTGLLSGNPKYEAITTAEGFVLPSYNEAQPMAILEAMAAGLVVVTTAVGDIPSVVRNGTDGLLVAPGDVNALAAAMLKLSQDTAMRRNMANSARQRVAERYSVEVVTNDLIKIYDNLLGAGK